jgi:hypothetical protein
MPALSTIVVFLLAALGILLIPGLAVLYILTQSAAQGSQAHQTDGVWQSKISKARANGPFENSIVSLK